MNHLSPKAEKYFFFRYLSILFPIAVAVFFMFIPYFAGAGEMYESPFFTSQAVIIWVSLLILYAVIMKIFAKLAYKNYGYELTDKSFRKERGVITKKYVEIPYSRIQNIDINRNVLARLLGLSNLNIQTAGISGQTAAEGNLPALAPEEALRLREELISRVDEQKKQGL